MEVLKRNFALLCNLYLSSCCYLKCVGQLPNWKSLIFFSSSPLNPFLPQGFCTPCFLFLSTLSSQILIRQDPWNLFPASLNVTSSEKPSRTFQAHAMLSLVTPYHIALHGRNCYHYSVYFLTYFWLLCSGAWTLESLTLRSLLDLQAWHVRSAQWGLFECKWAWMCISGICETLEHRPRGCPCKAFCRSTGASGADTWKHINQLVRGWGV